MELTKYEKTRIIGARALQIAMGAPILTKKEDELNPIRIAKKEFEENVLPISVRRVTPEKIEKKQVEEIEETTEETGEENKTDES
jgi:DNA-directed RNA polymerase subunit K